MFTLIKREIEDHLIYFIGAIIIASILVALLLSVFYISEAYERNMLFIGIIVPAGLALIIGFTGMGISQMYSDRNKKLSAFLCALPVTRGRILIARIITGILAILIVLVPVILTGMFLRRIFAPPIPIFPGLIFDVSVTAFLTAFACYCIGLQTGWTANRVAPSLGGLLLTCILVPLILVKGFGLYIKVMLILFIVASLTRTWQKFKSTAL